MWFFLFVILTQVFSCQHRDTQKLHLENSLKVELDGQTIILSENISNELQFILIGRTEIYYSRFGFFKTNYEFKNFVKKRKQIFLNQFEDDIEPYAGKVTVRSQCVKNIDSDSIQFVSGPGSNFSGCTETNTDTFPSKASRYWVLCGSTGFEVTLKADQFVTPLFHCQPN